MPLSSIQGIVPGCTVYSTDDPLQVLPGKELFRLYDTFGFPIDLARDIAEERGVVLDEAGFDAEMARQRERAQASWKGAQAEQAGEAYTELAKRLRTVFEGYSRVRVDEVEVLALLKDGRPSEALEEGESGELVLESTPFYAEAGGQVSFLFSALPSL